MTVTVNDIKYFTGYFIDHPLSYASTTLGTAIKENTIDRVIDNIPSQAVLTEGLRTIDYDNDYNKYYAEYVRTLTKGIEHLPKTQEVLDFLAEQGFVPKYPKQSRPYFTDYVHPQLKNFEVDVSHAWVCTETYNPEGFTGCKYNREQYSWHTYSASAVIGVIKRALKNAQLTPAI